MKHAVILAHPDAHSFNHAVAKTYVDAVAAKGHDTVTRDLYAMDFEPRLKKTEIVGREGFAPAADVVAERALLKDANVFAFVYPFWINAPPAILKGYIERVFGLGFAYGPMGSADEPLLKGKKMISFTSSGAPTEWARASGALSAEEMLFDKHISALSGLEVVAHVHFGGIVPGIRKDVAERDFVRVREAVAKYF